jgi:hypothetical protein
MGPQQNCGLFADRRLLFVFEGAPYFKEAAAFGAVQRATFLAGFARGWPAVADELAKSAPM